MNRYTYRDIFSSHKVAGPAVSPQAAVQAKAKAKAEADAKAEKAKQDEKIIKKFNSLELEINRFNNKIKASNDVKLMRTLYKTMEKDIKSIKTDELKTLDNFNRDINRRITALKNLYTEAGNYIKNIEGEQIAKAKEAKAATAKK
jgi:hypothetical protein